MCVCVCQSAASPFSSFACSTKQEIGECFGTTKEAAVSKGIEKAKVAAKKGGIAQWRFFDLGKGRRFEALSCRGFLLLPPPSPLFHALLFRIKNASILLLVGREDTVLEFSLFLQVGELECYEKDRVGNLNRQQRNKTLQQAPSCSRRTVSAQMFLHSDLFILSWRARERERESEAD